MTQALLAIAASRTPRAGEGEALARLPAATRQDLAWLAQDEVEARLAGGDPGFADAAVAVLMPSTLHPVSLGRRLHKALPRAHILFVQDPDGIAALKRALGATPMLGRHWSIVEADPAQVSAAVQQALASASRLRNLRTTLDAVNQAMAQTRAVTTTEYQRLVASEHHLSNFLRYAHAAVIGLDPARNVLFWSEGASELLGIPVAEALGRPLADLGPWAQPMVAALDRVPAGKGSVTVEEVLELRGRTRAVEALMSPPPAGGTGLGISIVLRDVTARRQAQEKLREANLHLQRMVSARTEELEKSQLALMQAQKLEAVGKLTGGVAHDFNNVLQIVGSNLQLLQARLQGEPEAGRLLRSAMEAVDRGAKLSSQLLAFARRQPLSPLPLNISRRVGDMSDLLKRAIGEQVEIETVLAAGLWTTMVDANQLENVILNLAINARDAMPEGGKLTIETANTTLDEEYTRELPDVAPGQYVMVAITDTGVGMAPEVLARAFEPFFTTKPEGQGTGLGLSMAYGFAKQSAGHLRIYSEPGMGTTVKLYLPRSHEKEVVPPPTSTGPIRGGSETVLVVEDDLSVQAAVVSMLQSLGYAVLRANDAQAALSILQSGVYVDLLFTDVVMPGPLRSPDLAQRARALLPDIAVLFTSGYTHNAIVHGGRLDPGVELLSKPYRKEDLARKIRHVLGNRDQVKVLQAAIEAPPAAAPQQLRVLLVEDQDDLRETSLQLLELLGTHAVGAADADEAERRLAAEPFDVLITDISLPRRSGNELAAAVVERWPHMKVVFCSGYGAAGAALPGRRTWSLPKPYALEQLEALLEAIRAEIGTPA
jgi:PAS domain S-box-containing protein